MAVCPRPDRDTPHRPETSAETEGNQDNKQNGRSSFAEKRNLRWTWRAGATFREVPQASACQGIVGVWLTHQSWPSMTHWLSSVSRATPRHPETPESSRKREDIRKTTIMEVPLLLRSGTSIGRRECPTHIRRQPKATRDIPRDNPRTTRDIPQHPETYRNTPRHPETTRAIPRQLARRD